MEQFPKQLPMSAIKHFFNRSIEKAQQALSKGKSFSDGKNSAYGDIVPHKDSTSEQLDKIKGDSDEITRKLTSFLLKGEKAHIAQIDNVIHVILDKKNDPRIKDVLRTLIEKSRQNKERSRL